MVSNGLIERETAQLEEDLKAEKRKSSAEDGNTTETIDIDGLSVLSKDSGIFSDGKQEDTLSEKSIQSDSPSQEETVDIVESNNLVATHTVDTCSKYDKLKPWKKVHGEILNKLRKSHVNVHNLCIPNEIQLIQSLVHGHDIHCLVHLKSHVGDTFVTQQNIGACNQLIVWNVCPAEFAKEVKTTRINQKEEIKHLIFIPKFRIYAAYCSDVHVRLYADHNNGFKQYCQILCSYTIHCLAFNKDTDELLAGGYGCLFRWDVHDFREALTRKEPLNISVGKDDQIISMKVDTRNKVICLLLDVAMYLYDYLQERLLQAVQNPHTGAFTCVVFHPERDYFITAARDGVIKVWSSTVFSVMTEFRGQYEAVTAMFIHPQEPLLFSASLDKTIRVWRLDTFQCQSCYYVGEKIVGMKLLNWQEMVYWTQTDVKIFQLNLFYKLYNATESGVIAIKRSKVVGSASRIVLCVEDGSIRIISPRSGATLSIVYPLPFYQGVTDVVYEREENVLYTLFSGEVLVFDCSTNPCEPLYRIAPADKDTTVMCIGVYTLKRNDDKDSRVQKEEILIFAGHFDGTISLLHSTHHCLGQPIKGHHGRVTIVTSSDNDNGQAEPVQQNRLITAGTDCTIRIWSVEQFGNGIDIFLNQIHSIKVCHVASHIAMLASTLCYALQNTGKVHIAHCGAVGEAVNHLDHHSDYDHTKCINGLSGCKDLHLFATTARDGLLKLWDTSGHLIRELQFDWSLQNVCFCNERGDLLVGFQNHVFCVEVQDYLPLELLEKLLLIPYKDDVNEEPTAFNHDVQLWFDYSELKTYPLNQQLRKHLLRIESLRSEITRVKRDEDIAAHETWQDRVHNAVTRRRSLPPITDSRGRSVVESSTRAVLSTQTPSELCEIAGEKSELDQSPLSQESSGRSLADSCQSSDLGDSSIVLDVTFLGDHSELDYKEDLSAREMKGKNTAGKSSPVKKVRSRRGSKNADKIIKHASVENMETSDKTEEELKLEKEKEEEEKRKNEEEERKRKEEFRKRFPVAPDGYIPNSVVRGVMKMQPVDTTQKAEEPFKLKPVPGVKLPARYSYDDLKSRRSSRSSLKWSETSLPTQTVMEEEPAAVAERGRESVDHSESTEPSTGRSSKVEFKASPKHVFGRPDGIPSAKAVKRRGVGNMQHYGTAKFMMTRDSTDVTEPELEFVETGSRDDESSGKPESGRHGRLMGQSVGGDNRSRFDRDDSGLHTSSAESKPKSSQRRFNFSMENRLPQVDLVNVRPVTRGSVTLSSPRSHRERQVERIMDKMKGAPKVDMAKIDIGDREALRKNKRERSLLSRQGTNTTMISEEDEDTTHPLLKQIKAEKWFPKQAPATVPGVTSAFISIMGNVSTQEHGQICGYIVAIQNEITFPKLQFDGIVNKLTAELRHGSSVVRGQAVRTLKDLGVDTNQVLVQLLPLLLDDDRLVKAEVAGALRQLAGVENKDDLVSLMQKLGHMDKEQPSSVQEAEALRVLQETLSSGSLAMTSEEMAARIQNWVSTVQGGDRPEDYISDEDLGISSPTKAARIMQRGKGQSVDQRGQLNRENSNADSQGSRGQPAKSKGHRDSQARVKGARKGKGQGQMGASEGQDSVTSSPAQEDYDEDGLPIYQIPGGAPGSGLRPGRHVPGRYVPGRDVPGRKAVEDEDEYGGRVAKSPRSTMYPDNPELYKIYDKQQSGKQGPIPDLPDLDRMQEGQKGAAKQYNWGKRRQLVTNSNQVGSGSPLGGAPGATSPRAGSESPGTAGVYEEGGMETLHEVPEEESEHFARETRGGSFTYKSSSSSKTPKYNGMEDYQLYEKSYRYRKKAYGAIAEWDDLSGSDEYDEEMYSGSPDEDEGHVKVKRRGRRGMREDSVGMDSAVDSDGFFYNEDGTRMEYDSGFGHSSDDNVSYRTRGHSLMSRGHPTLSPVKSISDVEGRSQYQWREFFDRPEAQGRKKIVDAKKLKEEELNRPVSLPPIEYIKEAVVIPGDPGVRLLQRVEIKTTREESGVDGSTTGRKHLINPVPGKLAVNSTDDTGSSKFGILNMSWTTGSNVAIQQKKGQGQTQFSQGQGAATEPDGTVPPAAQTKPVTDPGRLSDASTVLLPSLPASQINVFKDYPLPPVPPAGGFAWDAPLPPAPVRASRMDDAELWSRHQHYCHYYKLLKKGMHEHCSSPEKVGYRLSLSRQNSTSHKQQLKFLPRQRTFSSVPKQPSLQSRQSSRVGASSQPISSINSVSRLSVPLRLPSLAVIKTKGHPGVVLKPEGEDADEPQLTSRSLDGHMRHLERMNQSRLSNDLKGPIEVLEHNETDHVTLRTLLTES